MNKIPDEEKDLFIRKQLRQDQLVSKKYDDVFENFLKGDHEMKEEKEEKIQSKEEKTKVPKNRWVRSIAAVAACALIFAGANVYATTQGYDNIFFLIKDLGNKNKQVTATKDEILSDRDTIISFTNIEISDGLFLQVNRFVVKDGKASLFVTINQENAQVRPVKFIVSSSGVTLASENNESSASQYSYEIKLNNYKEEMKVLKLRIEEKNSVEIATLEIDLENKEIDLLASDAAEEVKKISEVDLKQKLGYYAVMLSPDYDWKLDKQYMLGVDLIYQSMMEKGINKNAKSEMDIALKEAMGTVLPTNFNSNIFQYNEETDAYETIEAGDWGINGLCLNVDDLKYENGKYIVTFTYCYPTDYDYMMGNIELIDRYQSTLEFVLNENATYTKYKVLNFETANVEQVQKQESQVPEKPIAEDTIPAHTHNYKVVKAEDAGEYHTTIDGEHTLICSICGDEKHEPHHFGKWWTINNGTAWTLWCEDCNQYVYTTDYDFVQSHLEYGMNPVEEETTTIDPSTVDNYASTMDWTSYWAPGLRLKYPTQFTLEEIGGYYRGNRQGEISTIISGIARGINRDTNEIIESNMEIEIYEPEYIGTMSKEEYVKSKMGYTVNDVEDLAGYTMDNSGRWYLTPSYAGTSQSEEYVHFEEMVDGSLWATRINIKVNSTTSETNWKVVNIINWLFDSIECTSY